jgi:hypothetical protein
MREKLREREQEMEKQERKVTRGKETTRHEQRGDEDEERRGRYDWREET